MWTKYDAKICTAFHCPRAHYQDSPNMKVIRVNETSQLDPTLSTESVKYDRTFVFFFGA